MLKDHFMALVSHYSPDKILTNTLWEEIETHYSSKGRHYHSLKHLENLLIQLESVKKQIHDWDTVIFAMYYHDIIYKSTRKDNEEKSADLAVERLTQINFPADKMELCAAHILATKKHAYHSNTDTNYFTDADLSILGRDAETYAQYAKQVRAEYSIYPDFMYNPGRQKALQHFLDMEWIFKTEEFRAKFEEQARKNITMEVGKL